LECSDRGIPAEAKTICGWVDAFRKGDKFEAVIPSSSVMMGLAFKVDGYGRLEDRYYDAAIGNGRPNEIGLFPVRAVTGVEDFEAQSIVDAKRAGQSLPKNEIMTRIFQHARPAKANVAPTKGKSIRLMIGGEKQIFLRRSGALWVLVAVTGTEPDQQARSSFVIAGLY
jgi:hypothetical protein